MDELLLESMLDPKTDKFSSLPPIPSPRTLSPTTISDRRSPYFRTHSPLTAYESSNQLFFNSKFCLYFLDRETIVKRDRSSPTLAETHLICKEGSTDSFYNEEHWSSEVSGFLTTSPPKFLQVIKPYRVLNTDQFTLFVKVRSDPPAQFSWSFNDTLIPINSQIFLIRSATNQSSLTVDEAKEGLYACSASNIAGTSKSYCYITVNRMFKISFSLNSTQF